jgi:hypothetical protein
LFAGLADSDACIQQSLLTFKQWNRNADLGQALDGAQ